MAKTVNDICEELLDSWVNISSVIKNERLVEKLTYNEMCVLAILEKDNTLRKAGKAPAEKPSAKDVANKTGMIKSQINRVINELLDKQYISVKQSKDDKRRSELSITKKGSTAYNKEHANVMVLVKSLYSNLGNKKATELTKSLNEAADAFKKVTGEA